VAGGVELYPPGKRGPPGPPGPPGPSGVLQVAYAALEVDFTSALGPTTFQDILSVSITTAGTTLLLIDADLSASEVVAPVGTSFRVTVDGVAPPGIGRGISWANLGVPNCAAFTARVAVGPGAHEVKIQGRNTLPISQFQIRAATSDSEGATLRVEEVPA